MTRCPECGQWAPCHCVTASEYEHEQAHRRLDRLAALALAFVIAMLILGLL